MKKTIAIIAAAGFMSFGIVDTAFASSYELNPLNTSFTGTGTTSATKNGVTLNCNATFQGNVDGQGIGHITSGSFTGDLGCTSVGLSGLPWKAAAVSKTRATIYKVKFTSPIGNCGPSNLKTTLKSGVITFTNAPLAGGCTVSGDITTSPTVKIVVTGP
jgi:hypothetical protein